MKFVISSKNRVAMDMVELKKMHHGEYGEFDVFRHRMYISCKNSSEIISFLES